MREFVFHTRVPDDIERRLEVVRASFGSHELQVYVAEDPAWEGYAQFD